MKYKTNLCTIVSKRCYRILYVRNVQWIQKMQKMQQFFSAEFRKQK